MYRISVTSLEKFRRFIAGTSPYDTEQALIETLSGEFKGNDYTAIGTAFHSLIEVGGSVCTPVEDWFRIEAEGVDVKMDGRQVEVALQHKNSIAGCVFEVRIGKDFQTPFFPIYVNGRCDGIYGLVVRDTKTKFSDPKADDYRNSYQWRLYLEILEADIFVFDVFQFEKYDKALGTDVRGLKLTPFQPIWCNRYLNMEQDNQRLVNEFCEYIEFRKLHHLLKLKVE